MGVHDSALCELVLSAAVGAFDRAGIDDVKKDAWMHAPEGRFAPWAVQRQILRSDEYGALVFS